MRRELLDLASELAARGEPFAIATVVARTPPISAQVGDMALVTRSGFHGWVGGSCTRPTVTDEGRKAIADGRPRLLALEHDPRPPAQPGLTVFPMTCHSGGGVQIHIRPVLPQPTLVVYGLSPIARALARLGKAMGYSVCAVDPGATAEAFPGVDALASDPGGLPAEKLTAPLLAVVATQGQWDEDAIQAALARQPAYLGVVASRKRFGEVRRLLEGRADGKALEAIQNPAGLDLGARNPEGIAVSILAEIVKRLATAEAKPETPLCVEAHDPVCGMSVTVRDETPRALHEGREFFFCCTGCRERFLRSPATYAGAGA
jgi:xanthine dehydrogenase accessory factor